MPYTICANRDADIVTRRAVATLEEARATCHAVLTDCDLNPAAQFDAQYAIQHRTSTSGGTIGPLPDGTVIEVAQVNESTLYNAIRPTLCCPTCGIQQRYVSGSHLIDAYNAAQGA